MARKHGTTTQNSAKKKDDRYSITLHFDPVKDKDTIDKLSRIPAGDRAPALKAIIRGKADFLAQLANPIAPELRDIREGVAWLQNALNDFPSYLEGLLSRVTVQTPQMPQASPFTNNKPKADKASVDRRTENMSKHDW